MDEDTSVSTAGFLHEGTLPVWELLEPYKRVCMINDALTSKELTFRTHMIRLFPLWEVK